MKFISTRMLYFVGLVLIAMVLGISYFLQTYDGMTPCPLCILQRFVMFILGGIFLLGVCKRFQGLAYFLMSLLAGLFSGMGILLAGRQIWLQHLPPNQNADCGASLEYMLRALPIRQVIEKIFAGSSECSVVDWRFINLSLADWSLVCFLGLFFLAGVVFFRGFNKR